MPAVNDVGEPGAREPHARFDGRELETERLVRVTEVGQPDGKPRASRLLDLPPKPRHRASSRPYTRLVGRLGDLHGSADGYHVYVARLHEGDPVAELDLQVFRCAEYVGVVAWHAVVDARGVVIVRGGDSAVHVGLSGLDGVGQWCLSLIHI